MKRKKRSPNRKALKRKRGREINLPIKANLMILQTNLMNLLSLKEKDQETIVLEVKEKIEKKIKKDPEIEIGIERKRKRKIRINPRK